MYERCGSLAWHENRDKWIRRLSEKNRLKQERIETMLEYLYQCSGEAS